MNFLAIDTATEMCSVAVHWRGETTGLAELAPRSHTELVLPMVDQLLRQVGAQLKDLDAIAFDRGPGAFTGLRIGAGIAQGLALGAALPVIPISSLATLAQGAYRQQRATTVLACIDARKHEVYWGCFQLEGELMLAIGAEQLSAPTAVYTPDAIAWYGVGSGFDGYAKQLTDNPCICLQNYRGRTYPLAIDMLPLVLASWREKNMLAAETALPVYLRNDVVAPITPGSK